MLRLGYNKKPHLPENSDDSMDHSEEDVVDQNDGEVLNDPSPTDQVKRKKKKGIIYVSSIPKYMNVTIAREIFGRYGEVGRVFLQPERSDASKVFDFHNKSRIV